MRLELKKYYEYKERLESANRNYDIVSNNIHNLACTLDKDNYFWYDKKYDKYLNDKDMLKLIGQNLDIELKYFFDKMTFAEKQLRKIVERLNILKIKY